MLGLVALNDFWVHMSRQIVFCFSSCLPNASPNLSHRLSEMFVQKQVTQRNLVNDVVVHVANRYETVP
jgi:hypothetical protein